MTMGWNSLAAAVVALVALMALPISSAAQTPVRLEAADGVAVFGETHDARGAARGTIVLFHQASSNRGEYAQIAPRLAAQGFNVIAIDQRSGGNSWGRANETVATLKRGASFEQALPDLEAALAYAVKRDGGPVIVWGSSYSASLVFSLAARRPGDVAAVLAFSPGEYFGGSRVRTAAAQVKAPIFVTSASDRGEIAEAKAIIDAAPAAVKVQHEPKRSTHGSSTLRSDSNPHGSADIWREVEAFLGRVAPAKS